MPLCQELAKQRQHRCVRKMEHYSADEEDNQWVILKEYPDAFCLPALRVVICATGELVVNLAGSD